MQPQLDAPIATHVLRGKHL